MNKVVINQNSDFLLIYQSTLSNPNGDPDQENKPRMDYETSTVLVSDARIKRNIRDFLKEKGYRIFVDFLAEQKVPMDVMFAYIRDLWLQDKERMEKLFNARPDMKEQWVKVFGENDDFYDTYVKFLKEKKDKAEKDKDFTKFNNAFLTEIVKMELVDIRLFGSVMAVKGVSKTFTGPIQINWGYSLHPVDIVKSSTITSIMNDDSSTFGKKYKLHYALIAHYGTINKYNAKETGMTDKDHENFRKAIVQSIMANQTDSKQGQEPLLYLEVSYKPEFDGYLGDLRRFLSVTHKENTIRSIDDVKTDFGDLAETITKMKDKGYIDAVRAWSHPFVKEGQFTNMPEYEDLDLWAPLKMEG